MAREQDAWDAHAIAPHGGTRPWRVEDTTALVGVGSVAARGDRAVLARTRADVEADRNTRQLVLVDPAGVRPLTDGSADHGATWLDDRRLVFLRITATGSQIVLLDVDEGHERSLAQLPAGALAVAPSPHDAQHPTRLAVIGWVPHDPAAPPHAPRVARDVLLKEDNLGVLVGRTAHLHVVDAGSGTVTRVTHGDAHVRHACWHPDGSRIAYAAAVHDRRGLDRRTDLFVVSHDGAPLGVIEAPDGLGLTPVHWLDDATLVVVGTPYAPAGHARLGVLDPAGGAIRWLFPDLDRNIAVGAPGYAGASPVVWGREVVFALHDRGRTHVWRGSVDGGPARPVVTGDVDVTSLSVTETGRLLFTATTRDEPSALFLVPDVDRQRDVSDLDQITTDNVGLRGQRALAPQEPVTFTVSDGTRIHGWLAGRRAPTPRPLVVDLHGGPHNAWSPTFRAAHLYQQELAAAGWLILTLNPRGSDGYGEAFFRGLVERGWGVGDEADVLEPVDQLVRDGVADPDRLVVVGYSYGGYLAAWLSLRQPGRFAAAVAGGVVSNRLSQAGDSDYGPGSILAETGRSVSAVQQHLWEVSPLRHVDGAATPTLLQHGERDTRCPLGQAEQLFVALKDRGVETELVTYPGANHLFVYGGRPSHRVDRQRRLIAWLDRHAGPATAASIDREPAQETRT